MNIFFDLDGTLIDSKERLFSLFQYLVPESTFTFEEYWKLKKKGIGHKQILLNHFNYTSERISAFEERWMAKIELEEWINLDQPFERITDYLIALGKNHKLFVVTARQSKEIVMRQIEQYGWRNIFEKILVTCQKTEKHDLISRHVSVTCDDWFIGDTGNDIRTGKELGINTVAVLTGFLSKEKLLEYTPDFIIERVTDLNF